MRGLLYCGSGLDYKVTKVPGILIYQRSQGNFNFFGPPADKMVDAESFTTKIFYINI